MLLYCTQIQAQDWNLVWSDEFDSLNINLENWKYETGGGGWGNNELEYYTNRAANATIENGNLLIIAKKETYGGSSYTSARLKTQGLQSFTYGKIESRIKLPSQQGVWPAFWTLGANISQVGWPKCGEIDIMEHINKATSVNGTLHWDNNGHVQAGKTILCDVTKYHVYAVEWDANSVKWLLDGKKYYEVSIASNVSSTEEIHNPMFILLNMAVGGNWPGSPNSTTVFPDTMYVDYVRVYQTGVTSGINNQKNGLYNLEQNYPNPFSSTTTISYYIPDKSRVSLKVFDLTGREVSSIVAGEVQAGKYTKEWNGSGFPEGIYFYRLQSGSVRETKKLIIMK